MNISEQCGNDVAVCCFKASRGLENIGIFKSSDWSDFVTIVVHEAVYSTKYWTKYGQDNSIYDLTVVRSAARSMAEKLLEVC